MRCVKVVDHAVDAGKLRVGDTIDVPYEVTVEASFRDFWLSAFHSNVRQSVSPLPFSGGYSLL